MNKAFKLKLATTYSPRANPVPSALLGLTSLFGMVRGEHQRYNHQKIFNILHSKKPFIDKTLSKAFG